MVVIGGITRLTQSGLSMVEWKPIMGIIPPISTEDWMREFDLYKSSPEFKFYNSQFTLSDFKSIFFWEYLHRLLGRIIGLVFIIPGFIFWVKGFFTPKMKRNVIIIFLGGILQGFLGWFMVKSGLVDNPHVSHYRLAAHLLTALALIVYIYWVALLYSKYDSKRSVSLINVKWFYVLIAFFSVQIMYGAFVAGLKAGKMYNSFPKMGEVWLPTELIAAFSKNPVLALVESPSVIQLMHRILGVLCLILTWLLFIKIKDKAQKEAFVFLSLVLLQVLIGIGTLLFVVPISFGVIHQTIAIFILIRIFRLKFISQYHSRIQYTK